MILRHAAWNPNIMPCMKLTESDICILADELAAFHAEFHSCFGRKEHHRLGLAYISGLLSNSEAKSVEPIALEFLDVLFDSFELFLQPFSVLLRVPKVLHEVP